MLDQLVESKSNSRENKRRSEFLMVTLVVMVSLLVTGWTYSLFAKDFGMGGDDLALTTLVAPVPVPDEAPPEKQPENKVKPEVATRTELIARVEDNIKIPDVISNEKPKIPPIPKYGDFAKGTNNNDVSSPGVGTGREVGDSSGTSNLGGTGTPPSAGDETTPPPPPPKKAPPKTVSGGVLNGKATSLPKPAYPPAARAVRAGGPVSVQVLIDEGGRVVSANAVSGHPLLRAAAEGAARGARFSPTLLSGQPVKVSGVITYNFVP